VAETVVVHEVGLRDGLQNQPRLVPLESKLAMLDALIEAGCRSIEATSFVSPKAVPQMADAAELYARLPRDAGINFEALVPNERGYDRAVECGVTTVALVLAATDTFNRKNINMSLDKAVAVNEAVIGRAKADGIRARSYISVATACPYEGPTPPEVVFDLTARMINAGADEVVISDSIGAGNPNQMQFLFETLARRYGPEMFAGHFHDTRGMGLTLTWVALQCGIRKFDSSIGGLGGCPFAPGATGNLATEDLVFMLNEAGFETGMTLDGLSRAVKVAEEATAQSLGGSIMGWYRAQAARKESASRQP